jgi:predicted heme/steroid binding protein
MFSILHFLFFAIQRYFPIINEYYKYSINKMVGEAFMERQRKLVCNRVQRIIGDLNNYTDNLYLTPCMYSRNMILNQLKSKIQELQFLSSMICTQDVPLPLSSPQSSSTQRLPTQSTFTLEELSKYNGKNGNPAYVAVNGTVYDVTNNAGWAAATHFGLSAGKDLSNEFASCHGGQQILSRLNVVGRLVS